MNSKIAHQILLSFLLVFLATSCGKLSATSPATPTNAVTQNGTVTYSSGFNHPYDIRGDDGILYSPGKMTDEYNVVGIRVYFEGNYP